MSAATALERELDQVGFHATLVEYPTATYASDFAGVPSYAHAHHLGVMFMQWSADWPDGYGFLDDIVNGDEIPAAGNFNLGELNDPTVNALLARGIATTDTARRDAIWGQVDRDVMAQAVIVPLVYGKALYYRPSDTTNVTVSEAYGEYDYPILGPAH